MQEDINIRKPAVTDGKAIWSLVRETGVLDLNSAYLYLLLCRDFSETCLVAERDGVLLGFVSGYRPPDRPDNIFLWQIGVSPRAQGLGLGKRLVHAFLATPGACGARTLETTISPSNAASRALFSAVARELGAGIDRHPGFLADDFPPGHEAEDLYLITPLLKPNEDLP